MRDLMLLYENTLSDDNGEIRTLDGVIQKLKSFFPEEIQVKYKINRLSAKNNGELIILIEPISKDLSDEEHQFAMEKVKSFFPNGRLDVEEDPELNEHWVIYTHETIDPDGKLSNM